MPSQIKVDEIKNVAGQYKIKTDVVEGQTTAGSITVQGEGTATTNLQQGLAKAWVNYDAVDQATKGSLNQSSLTDHATGEFTTSHSNNFNSAEDKCISTCEWNTIDEGANEAAGAVRGGTASCQHGGASQSTSSLRWDTFQGTYLSGNGSNIDYDGSYCMIMGALA